MSSKARVVNGSASEKPALVSGGDSAHNDNNNKMQCGLGHLEWNHKHESASQVLVLTQAGPSGSSDLARGLPASLSANHRKAQAHARVKRVMCEWVSVYSPTLCVRV